MAGRVGKRMFGPAQLTASAATKYTVGANRRGIIRHIHFYNADATARTVTCSIGTDAAGTRILDQFSIASKQPYDHYCYHVLEATEILQAFADVTLQVTMTVNGDEEVLA